MEEDGVVFRICSYIPRMDLMLIEGGLTLACDGDCGEVSCVLGSWGAVSLPLILQRVLGLQLFSFVEVSLRFRTCLM